MAMTWTHPGGYAPAADHEGRPAAVRDDGTLTEVPESGGGPGGDVAALTAVCACGWRSAEAEAHYVRGRYPSLDASLARALRGEWEDHLRAALPEILVAEALDADAVGAAVREARAAGASWARIGAAAGTSRQAAHERWKHLDPGDETEWIAALPGALFSRGGDDRRLLLSDLLQVDPEHLDPARSAAAWSRAYAAYLRERTDLLNQIGEARGEGLREGYATGYAEGRAEAVYDADQVRFAAANRPGQGARTDRM